VSRHAANAEGQPYVPDRGGPPGFLEVIDDHTPGSAEIRDNRQYIAMDDGRRVPSFLERDVLDRHVPVGRKDLEAPLLDVLEPLLIGEEVLPDSCIERGVVGDDGILEDDRDPVVPAALLGGVGARRDGREL
jgi:hypothetical protein